mgnify:CR=1 FL=1
MLEQMGKQAKDAAFILAQLNTTEKNHALSIIADQLEQQADRILAANQKDIEIAKQNGITLAYTTNPNIRNSDMKIIKQRVFELKKQNALSDFYINNIGLLDFIKELKVERIYADYALNITNDLSIDFYIELKN